MRRLDARSGRTVWLVAASSVDDWPASPPWPSEHFGLLVATDRAVDIGPLAARALAQGLAVVAAWGPGCARMEIAFDGAVCDWLGDTETADNVVLTTSHARDTLDEALVWFLDMFFPAWAYEATCTTWVIFALGETAREIAALLDARA